MNSNTKIKKVMSLINTTCRNHNPNPIITSSQTLIPNTSHFFSFNTAQAANLHPTIIQNIIPISLPCLPGLYPY